MDVTITKNLLTALRLEVAPFYGNTNVVGLIDAICREIDGADKDTCSRCGGELDRHEGLCNTCDSCCPDYAAAYARRRAQ